MSNTKNSEHKVEPSSFHTILRKKKKKKKKKKVPM